MAKQPFFFAVKEYLEERAKTDPLFAVSHAKENKSLGDCFVLDKQEKDADIVIQGWVARDGSGSLNVFDEEPARDEKLEMWSDGLDHFGLPYSSFPDLTWGSDPIKVSISIKRE